MLWLALGGFTLFAFLGGLRAFERASVSTVKSLLAWIAALAGLSLALLLVLTGREGIALVAAPLVGPLIWEHFRAAHPKPSAGAGFRPPPPPPRGGPMTPDEAFQVLGLRPGASEAAIRAAHKRLMRAAHPDTGGSDWLASRINMARDVLLASRAGQRGRA
jgi:DnaJ homolog subfamily C member 19